MTGQPLVILLVEDNDDHAEIVLSSLQERRVANRFYRVVDGEAALDFLLRRGVYVDPADSPRPNLILLDLRLPKLDGLDVLRQIKESETLCRIPVVILTTSAAERDVAKAYQYHANSYLVKPVDFDRFLNLMEGLGFYWLAWNRNPTTAELERELQ